MFKQNVFKQEVAKWPMNVKRYSKTSGFILLPENRNYHNLQVEREYIMHTSSFENVAMKHYNKICKDTQLINDPHA